MAVLSSGRRCPNAAVGGSTYCQLPQHQALSRFGTSHVDVLASLSTEDIALLADPDADETAVNAIVTAAEGEFVEPSGDEAEGESADAGTEAEVEEAEAETSANELLVEEAESDLDADDEVAEEVVAEEEAGEELAAVEEAESEVELEEAEATEGEAE
jgi:N utilization substance protein A